MLGKNTDNDLSFNKATVDLAATRDAVAIARGLLLQEIRRDIDKISENWIQNKRVSSVYSESLQDKANQLASVNETFATLVGAMERENINIRREDS